MLDIYIRIYITFIYTNNFTFYFYRSPLLMFTPNQKEKENTWINIQVSSFRFYYMLL